MSSATLTRPVTSTVHVASTAPAVRTARAISTASAVGLLSEPSSRTEASGARIGRVLAMPLSAVFVSATVLASVFFTVGILSNRGAERLQRGDRDAQNPDAPVGSGILDDEFLFFNGEL